MLHLLSGAGYPPPPPRQAWIAWQLLLGLAQCHEVGVCHGDIKPENVLVTSWAWAYLADFAPYKPTLLPEDNPVSAHCWN
jgi:serine/threonine protein kinase